MPALRYRPFCRTILLAGILLIAPATAPQSGGALAAAEKQRTSIHVTIAQGLLTVDLRDAPLADVLQAIAEKASFRLTLRGDLSTPVTWSFTGVPLAKGIERLVGDNSLMMIHVPTNDASLLSQVWVRAPGKRMVMFEPSPSPDPAVYQNGDPPESTAQRRASFDTSVCRAPSDRRRRIRE